MIRIIFFSELTEIIGVVDYFILSKHIVHVIFQLVQHNKIVCLANQNSFKC